MSIIIVLALADAAAYRYILFSSPRYTNFHGKLISPPHLSESKSLERCDVRLR